MSATEEQDAQIFERDAEIQSLQHIIDGCRSAAYCMQNEITQLRIERDSARMQFDRAMNLLVGIHGLISPAPIVHGGAVYVFNPTDARQQLQALSDRIRSLPDDLDKIGRTWAGSTV